MAGDELAGICLPGGGMVGVGLSGESLRSTTLLTVYLLTISGHLIVVGYIAVAGLGAVVWQIRGVSAALGSGLALALAAVQLRVVVRLGDRRALPAGACWPGADENHDGFVGFGSCLPVAAYDLRDGRVEISAVSGGKPVFMLMQES